MPAAAPWPTSSKLLKWKVVRCAGLISAVEQRLQRAEHHRDAGLVVQMARLDVAGLGDGRARVPGDHVAHFDAQGPRLGGAGDRRVEPDLHLVVLPLFVRHRLAMHVDRRFHQHRGAGVDAAVGGANRAVLAVDGEERVAADAVEHQPASWA